MTSAHWVMGELWFCNGRSGCWKKGKHHSGYWWFWLPRPTPAIWVLNNWKNPHLCHSKAKVNSVKDIGDICVTFACCLCCTLLPLLSFDLWWCKLVCSTFETLIVWSQSVKHLQQQHISAMISRSSLHQRPAHDSDTKLTRLSRTNYTEQFIKWLLIVITINTTCSKVFGYNTSYTPVTLHLKILKQVKEEDVSLQFVANKILILLHFLSVSPVHKFHCMDINGSFQVLSMTLTWTLVIILV